MKNFVQNLLAFSLGLALVLFAGHFIFGTTQVSAQSGGSNYITKMNISTSASITPTSSVILPASSGRVYAAIVNDGSAPVYLSMNGSPAVANQGLRLNGNGGSYEINFLNQYVGSIAATTATPAVSDLTITAAQ